DKILRTGDVAQRKVLRWRANKDHVIVLDVIEREQAAALHPNLAVQHPEGVIECMDRQHLPNAGVVLKNFIARIAGGIEVTHSRLGASHEGPVAENHPGFFRPVGEGLPEGGKSGGSWSRIRRLFWRPWS